MTENRGLVLMVKPVGNACNMACSYCYYLSSPGSRPAPVMSTDVLSALILQACEATEEPEISMVWHGGEPTLAGLSFFQEVVETQKRLAPDRKFWNSLQTNGLLLDDAWADFLMRESFSVGLSLDGTALLHDRFRRTREGEPTWERVLSGLESLRRHGLQPDLLCTVHRETTEYARQVYEELRDLNTGWIQFIPIVRRDEQGQVTPDSVTPEGYGRFLKEVFSRWFFHDLERTEIQFFSECARVLSGGEAGLCWMRETCGQVPVIEADGSVFSCDHYVRPSHRMGSISETPLSVLIRSGMLESFGACKQALSETCSSCPWVRFCHGLCPKDRLDNRDPWLCDGLRSFFAYALPHLSDAMRLSALHVPRSEIMRRLTDQERKTNSAQGRNDPCPCGSGRKYKTCCMKYCP